MVFVCFNRNDKVDPLIFNTWMLLLARTPRSVLWLLGNRCVISSNLPLICCANPSHHLTCSPVHICMAPRQ